MSSDVTGVGNRLVDGLFVSFRDNTLRGADGTIVLDFVPTVLLESLVLDFVTVSVLLFAGGWTAGLMRDELAGLIQDELVGLIRDELAGLV